MLHPQPKYSNYKELDHAVRRTTNARARQISQWLSARFVSPGVYSLYLDNINAELARLTSDNVITFTLPTWMLSSTSMTLKALSKYLPVGFVHLKDPKTPVYQSMEVVSTLPDSNTAVEYYRGAKINLLTGECLNRPTYLVATAIPSRLDEFDKAYCQWVEGIKHRVRMGVMDSIGVDGAPLPCWNSPTNLDRIVKAMRDNTYDIGLLSDIKSSLAVIDSPDGSPSYIDLLEQLLVPLKRLYGVYGEAVRYEYIDILSNGAQ